MKDLPIHANEIAGFKEAITKANVKKQLAECVLATNSLDRFEAAENILSEAYCLNEEAWRLACKYLKIKENPHLKYDSYSGLIYLA